MQTINTKIACGKCIIPLFAQTMFNFLKPKTKKDSLPNEWNIQNKNARVCFKFAAGCKTIKLCFC